MQAPTQPRTGTPSDVVDGVLNDLMAVGRHLRRRMAADGLDFGTFFILKTLRERGAVRVTELAACAGLDASTVSRHIGQLERAGQVERTPDPDDGRASRVALSRRGADVLDDASQRRRALLQGSLADWPPADVAHLQTLLDRLVASLDKEQT